MSCRRHHTAHLVGDRVIWFIGAGSAASPTGLYTFDTVDRRWQSQELKYILCLQAKAELVILLGCCLERRGIWLLHSQVRAGARETIRALQHSPSDKRNLHPDLWWHGEKHYQPGRTRHCWVRISSLDLHVLIIHPASAHTRAWNRSCRLTARELHPANPPESFRTFASLVTVGGYVLLLGGRDESSQIKREAALQMYCPRLNKWLPLKGCTAPKALSSHRWAPHLQCEKKVATVCLRRLERVASVQSHGIARAKSLV